MYRDGKLKTCKELEEKKVPSTNQSKSHSNILTGNGLGEVTGEREIQRIHQENIERLKSMDEREIFAEKEKLLNTLGKKKHSFSQSSKMRIFPRLFRSKINCFSSTTKSTTRSRRIHSFE